MAITMRCGAIFTLLLPLGALWWRCTAWRRLLIGPRKGTLGSDPDPMEPGVANLIVAFGITPWPHTLSLARVHVAPKIRNMCSIIEAVESARECFSREKGLKAAHYYLTPVYTEAPYILSDAGLQAADGSAMVIGVAAWWVLGTVYLNLYLTIRT